MSSGISYDPEFADVDQEGYVSGTQSVTSTPAEAKVGVSRMARREGITITNKGPDTVYYGPSGVSDATGDALMVNQYVSLNYGDQVPVFVVCSTGKTATIVVQEGTIAKKSVLGGGTYSNPLPSLTSGQQNPFQLSPKGALNVSLQDQLGNSITSGVDGDANVRMLHIQTPDSLINPTTLGSLNAAIQISVAGLSSAGFQINAGTFIGKLIPESSVDGGNNWAPAVFIDPATSNSLNVLEFTTNNTQKILGIVPIGGASHVRVRVSAYTSGSATATLRASCIAGIVPTIVQIISPYPVAQISSTGVISASSTKYLTYAAAQRLAIKQFYVGGSGLGKQTLWRYYPTSTQLLQYGDFESAGDVSQWTVVDPGGNNPVVSYSTDQAYTGTGSVKVVYSKSDINNYTGLRRTFTTPINVSVWKTLTASFYNIVPVGAAITRTISIILTDSYGSTRTYRFSGLTRASPFNASGWILITGDIRNPTSSVGTFDMTSVASLELRMVDSNNRTGTIYWDSVYFKEGMSPLFPVYHQAQQSFNLPMDPVVVLEIGDNIIITQTSFDTVNKEYYAFVGAIAI